MPADRLKAALAVEWLVLSTVLLATLITTLLLPPDALAVLAPQCSERIATGRPCTLCATVTSLLLVSAGQFDAAVHESVFGIPLYAALVWNECLALVYAGSELRRLWAQLRRPRQHVRTEEYSCRL